MQNDFQSSTEDRNHIVASTYRENGVTQMVKTTNSLDINWKTGGEDQRHGGYMKMVKESEGTTFRKETGTVNKYIV